jgi:exonuclease III
VLAGVYKERRFSDHAPLMVEYDWPALVTRP